MLRIVWVVLFIVWLMGLGFHFGGALIHLFLVVALVFLAIDLLNRRRITV
ncbi:MAG: lmo0937 family membrane protein [Terriglobales bacterium]